MEKYIEETKDIPWGSRGRETVASKVGKSLIPVGTFKVPLPKHDSTKPPPIIDSSDPNYKAHLMEIRGTAIYAGEDKIVTCQHVLDEIDNLKKSGYMQLKYEEGNTVAFSKYRYTTSIPYIDPRSKATNDAVDLALVPMPIERSPILPVDPPHVVWGDSTELGVGDPIIVGGYPYGTDMFTLNTTNQGFIQPSFYPGIISCIVPALNETETRILQISTAVAGGMSGGAVFLPHNGEVVGMVFKGLTGAQGDLHPVTYALPSEVISPFVKMISFKTKDGKHRGKSA